PFSSSSSFHRSPYTPDLHSFPTRRSSDLAADHEFVLSVTNWNRVDDVVEIDDLCRQLQTSPDPIFSRLQELLRARRWDPVRSEADRKSTRLNSSHGSSSYAVFCLKKKKNT